MRLREAALVFAAAVLAVSLSVCGGGSPSGAQDWLGKENGR